MNDDDAIDYKALYKASQISSLITGTGDNRVLEVNDQWTGQFGRDREQVIGKPIADIGLWRDHKALDHCLDKLLSGLPVTDFEATLMSGGVAVDFLVSARLTVSTASRWVLWEFRSVSLLSKTLRQLQSQRALYQSVLDHSTDSIQVFSVDGTPLKANAAWEKMWGVPFSALANYNLFKDQQLSSSGALDLLKLAFEGRAVRLRPTYYDKGLSESVSGQSGELWIEAFAYPVVNEEGTVSEVVIVQHDVTLSKQLELMRQQRRKDLERSVQEGTEQLRIERNRLETILNSIPGVVGYWDAQERNVFANRTYQEWLGVEPDTMSGRALIEIFGEERYLVIKPRVDAVLQGEPQLFESLYPDLSKPGEFRCAEVHYIPDRQEGQVRGFYVLAFEISNLKRLVDEANVANHAKGTFLSNMSHEIRTPLNAIVGMTYMLRTTRLDDLQVEYLKKLESAGHHLMQLVNDVLDLSKIEAGKVVLESKEFNLHSLMSNVATMLADRASDKKLQISLDIDLDGHTFEGDPTRLQQVLLNYGSNAIKFSENGNVEFRVSLLGQDGDDAHLRFDVRDYGIGIPAEKIPRLFSAFEQADASTTRKYGGTGLGLAISKRIAQLMGGEVGVESAQGRGSNFWFTARLKALPDDTDLDSLPWTDSIKAELKDVHRGTRVLVADDDPVNLEIATFLLDEIGFVTEQADDGEQALAVATAQEFDLVLLDVQMPVMDGLEVSRRLQQMDAYARVPVIAITGNVFSEDRQVCRDAGMSLFIPKPIAQDDFYQTLWEALSGKRAKTPG